MDSLSQAESPIDDQWLIEHFDHISPSLGAGLTESMARMRTVCPVTHSDQYGGFWVATKYRDVSRIAQDWETFSSAQGVAMPRAEGGLRSIPEEIDPPLQRVYKRLINRYLTLAAVKEWEAPTRTLASRLIDSFIDKGHCDFMADFARPYPSLSFFEFTLNAPSDDIERLAYMSWKTTIPNDPEAAESRAGLANWISEFVEQRRTQPPKGDVVDGVLDADIEGRPITHDEVVGIILLLILGGLETTTGALGHMMIRFSRQPEIQTLLRDRPELIPSGVEELLRLDGPFIAITRTATRDVEIGSRQIKKGDKVIIYWASADRDEEEFPEAERFDLGRLSNRHLAFGLGPHRCAGSNLARMNLRIALEELLGRLDHIELQNGADIRYHSIFNRAPLAVPLTFTQT